MIERQAMKKGIRRGKWLFLLLLLPLIALALLIPIPYYPRADTSPYKITSAYIEQLRNALHYYYRDNGVFPRLLDQLTTPEPYFVTGRVPKWDRVSELPFLYVPFDDAKHYVLIARLYDFRRNLPLQEFMELKNEGERSEFVNRFQYDPTNGARSAGDLIVFK